MPIFLFLFYFTMKNHICLNHIQSFSINIPHAWSKFVLLKWIYCIYPYIRGQSWSNSKRVGLVTQRLRLRVSGPAGIVGGGSECPVLSPPSIPWLRWDPWVRHRTPNCSPGLNQASKRILPILPGQGQYSLWCWRGSLACSRPKTGCWGRIIILLLFAVLYCIQYSTLN